MELLSAAGRYGVRAVGRRALSSAGCGVRGAVECEAVRRCAMEFGAYIAALIPEAGGELVGRTGRLDLAHP